MDQLNEAAELIRKARRIAVMTGAGISAESGIPTFRDALTGLWARYDPEELATPEAFARHPKLVWDWYAERRRMVRGCEPNAGHRALAQLEDHCPEFALITQNVDGLHQRAGSRKVHELHGNILRVRCSREGTHFAEWNEGAGDGPPPCPNCGAMLRPDVVWFGEQLPEEVFAAAERASTSCEVFLVVGTSGVVYPAAGLASLAAESGATVMEINPEETPLSHLARISLRKPAGELLPLMISNA